MKFGVTVAPRVSDWKLFVDLETMGYDCAWAADSQMLYSDAYAVLALAAEHTSRIRLGTGVAVAPTRLAPVTAHSIASINQLAPGRVFLGIGTGHTAMRVMGQDPMKAGAFREYLRVLRALLHGEEVDYALGDGERSDIRFLHPDAGFIDVAHPVPIYVAADGPLALKAAGAYGDGRVCSHNQTRARLQKSLETMQQGASAVGRSFPDTFHTAVSTPAAEANCAKRDLGNKRSCSDPVVVKKQPESTTCRTSAIANVRGVSAYRPPHSVTAAYSAIVTIPTRSG